MKRFKGYAEAEDYLIKKIVQEPDYITKTTFEVIGTGFILERPDLNRNGRSNYPYAQAFYEWMTTGQRELSKELIEHNPWVQRFVDGTGLPESFSSSYGWKIAQQMDIIRMELKAVRESRRAYVNILFNEDKLILQTKTTMEFPCTIGFQLFIRNEDLHMIVNMRSNNVYAVMPYDVYNFTMFQQDLAKELGVGVGYYYHQINNAHIFKGDVRRIKEQMYAK